MSEERRKIIKGNHQTIIINNSEQGATVNIPPPNSIPTINNYHQDELVDYETYLEHSETTEETLRKEKENDEKIEEFKRKRNIKLAHNYTPFLKKDSEDREDKE